MQDYLDNEPNVWTMKRLYLKILQTFQVSYRRGSNAKTLGSCLDFFISAGSEVSDTKRRWSSKLDIARLLMVMFGDEDAREAYIKFT